MYLFDALLPHRALVNSMNYIFFWRIMQSLTLSSKSSFENFRVYLNLFSIHTCWHWILIWHFLLNIWKQDGEYFLAFPKLTDVTSLITCEHFLLRYRETSSIAFTYLSKIKPLATRITRASKRMTLLRNSKEKNTTALRKPSKTHLSLRDCITWALLNWWSVYEAVSKDAQGYFPPLSAKTKFPITTLSFNSFPFCPALRPAYFLWFSFSSFPPRLSPVPRPSFQSFCSFLLVCFLPSIIHFHPSISSSLLLSLCSVVSKRVKSAILRRLKSALRKRNYEWWTKQNKNKKTGGVGS